MDFAAIEHSEQSAGGPGHFDGVAAVAEEPTVVAAGDRPVVGPVAVAVEENAVEP